MAPSSTRQVLSVSPSHPARVLPSKSGFDSARQTGDSVRATKMLRTGVNRQACNMVLPLCMGLIGTRCVEYNVIAGTGKQVLREGDELVGGFRPVRQQPVASCLRR